MKNIKLLDCTLRDGGYINDWKFGHDNIVSIFERVVDAGIDIIEIGFLDDRRPFDMDRSIMPDTRSVEKIYGKLKRNKTMVVGMIDYGTCDISHIQPCGESYLDGIRVIFKKHLREKALDFCRQLKQMGYKVFAQLVSVTSYTDEELADLIRLANEVHPYAVSMVDTYGLMHQDNLMHYFELLNNGLDKSIGLGYHAHNNFQMGYANCITMLANRIDRLMIVDGSLYGMGKSAGNAPLELLAMHMNGQYSKTYRIGQLLEAMDANITEFYHPAEWGYNMFYYLAAANDCHPNYVAYLMEKRTLSVNSVNEILGRLQGDKKLLFDRDYIENLYVDYQNNEVNDASDRERLAVQLNQGDLLLIGPGASINANKESIAGFVASRKPTVISINFIPGCVKPDFVFLSNSKRYVQLSSQLINERRKIIATSNITEMGSEKFDYVLNYSTLIDRNADIVDNSLIMFLKAVMQTGRNEVYLAGFDGYSSSRPNYFNNNLEYDFIKNKASYLNEYTRRFLTENKEKLRVNFLTPSFYCNEKNKE